MDFKEIYPKYADIISKILENVDEDDVRDIQQIILEKIERFRDEIERPFCPRSVKAWVRKVTRTSISNFYKSRKYLETTPLEEYNPITGEEENKIDKEKLDEKTAEDYAVRRELRKQINDTFSKVHESFKAPLKLWTEGKSYEEIADTLAIPLGTVKSRINRGRECFKENFKGGNYG